MKEKRMALTLVFLLLFSSAPGLPVAAPPQTGPPLPPQGLPPGWTMEQWAWYGEDYLNNR